MEENKVEELAGVYTFTENENPDVGSDTSSDPAITCEITAVPLKAVGCFVGGLLTGVLIPVAVKFGKWVYRKIEEKAEEKKRVK